MYRGIIVGLVVGVMIFFMGSCSAQEEVQDKTEQTKTEEIDTTDIIDVNNKYCPVSGEKINDELASTYVHEGKRYRFCCVACISSFKKNPEKYIKIIEEEIQPPAHEHMH